jgi:hypothetical protein
MIKFSRFTADGVLIEWRYSITRDRLEHRRIYCAILRAVILAGSGYVTVTR